MTSNSIARVALFVSLVFAAVVPAAPAAAAGPPRILVLGDSLSAAYGIDLDEGWVARLQERLREAGYPHEVINASVSGDTTRGALARAPRALERHRPEVVIVELGGNDGLRGIPTNETRENLAGIVEAARSSGAEVLLLGMRLPANYGDEYGDRFRRIYRDLARRYDAALLPFFLEPLRQGGDLDSSLMQADGIHPNARAQPLLARRVQQALEPLLESPGGSRGAANGS